MQLAADSRASLLVGFPNAAPGGTLRIEFNAEDPPAIQLWSALQTWFNDPTLVG
jgi:hypothetical protein